MSKVIEYSKIANAKSETDWSDDLESLGLDRDGKDFYVVGEVGGSPESFLAGFFTGYYAAKGQA